MNTIPGSTISCSGICLIKSLAYSLTRTPAGFSMYQSYHGAPASAGCRVEIFIKELVDQFEYQAVKTQNPPF